MCLSTVSQDDGLRFAAMFTCLLNMPLVRFLKKPGHFYIFYYSRISLALIILNASFLWRKISRENCLIMFYLIYTLFKGLSLPPAQKSQLSHSLLFFLLTRHFAGSRMLPFLPSALILSTNNLLGHARLRVCY